MQKVVFFSFFFWGRETKKNPKKLKRRDLKNNTWAWLIVFTYFSWPRLRDRHIFIRKLRRIPILRNNNGLHRHISKQGQTNPCKMFSREWKPLCTNPHLMLESKWIRCGVIHRVTFSAQCMTSGDYQPTINASWLVSGNLRVFKIWKALTTNSVPVSLGFCSLLDHGSSYMWKEAYWTAKFW